MKVSESKYKNQIGEYFEYSMEWDFLDIVAKILEGIDFESKDLDESVYNAIDNALIYTVDRWTIMEFYQTPEQANFDDAVYDLTTDIMCLAYKIKGE